MSLKPLAIATEEIEKLGMLEKVVQWELSPPLLKR
jgi:hypothetical protein